MIFLICYLCLITKETEAQRGGDTELGKGQGCPEEEGKAARVQVAPPRGPWPSRLVVPAAGSEARGQAPGGFRMGGELRTGTQQVRGVRVAERGHPELSRQTPAMRVPARWSFQKGSAPRD